MKNKIKYVFDIKSKIPPKKERTIKSYDNKNIYEFNIKRKIKFNKEKF